MSKKNDDHFRRRKAVDLAEEIRHYLSENLPYDVSRSLNLQTVWNKVASPLALEHTDNVVFSKPKTTSNKTKNDDTESSKGAVILIFVDNSSWAAEFNMQKEYYRIRMEQELGKKVDEVKFYVSRTAALRKK